MTSTTTARTRVHRALAGVFLLAPVVAAGALLPSASAVPGPPSSTVSGQAAAGWIEDRLEASGGTLVFAGTTTTDHGLTIDAALALRASGSGADAADAATTAVLDDVATYIGYEWEGVTYYFGNATAKALFAAAVEGVDPRDVGGVDLVARLASLTTAEGKIADDPAEPDYANTIGQSFAVLALHRLGEPTDLTADYLRTQQCSDGGFTLTPTPAGGTCTSHTDATAFAVQALIAVDGISSSAGQSGAGWLASQQQANGGVADLSLSTEANSNTTGLAGQAFHAAGRTAQARLAADFVEDLQYGCSFPSPLRGGIAYSAQALADQAALGQAATGDPRDERASMQAAFALNLTSLGELSPDGAYDDAPTLECAATSTTTTTSSSTTTTSSSSTTTSATTTTAPSATTSTTGAVATSGGSVLDGGVVAAPVRDRDRGDVRGGALARTGSEVAPFVGVALALVLVGAVLVAVRRSPRGRHQ